VVWPNPNLAKQSRVFHTMCRHAGFWWGGRCGGTHSRLGSAWRPSCPGERVCCASLCRVFSLSVSLLFLFPLFAVLLNCPYPDPPVSASFFSFSSACRRGEGRPRGAFVTDRHHRGGAAAWRFCCRPHQTNTLIWRPAWGRDNGRAEQRVLKQLS